MTLHWEHQQISLLRLEETEMVFGGVDSEDDFRRSLRVVNRRPRLATCLLLPTDPLSLSFEGPALPSAPSSRIDDDFPPPLDTADAARPLPGSVPFPVGSLGTLLLFREGATLPRAESLFRALPLRRGGSFSFRFLDELRTSVATSGRSSESEETRLRFLGV